MFSFWWIFGGFKINSNYTQKIQISFVIVVTILIIHFTKPVSSTVIHKTEKTKRSITMNHFNNEESKTNIEVIPQSDAITQHPNHRYIANKPQTPISREDRSENPFERKIHKHFPETPDFIAKAYKSKEKGKLVNELLTDKGSSMRLKGIYVKSRNLPKNQLDGMYFYSKEINNLMLNDGKGEEGDLSLKFKSHGAPFQLPAQENLTRKKMNTEKIRLRQIFTKHPVTMYLEFYPAKHSENLNKKLNSDSNIFKHSDNSHNSEMSYSFNVEKIILPQDRRNRMIMKLNLYPKESNFSKHHFSKQRTFSGSKYNTKAERKSFGWFFKQKNKKKNSKDCSVMVIRPHGKRIMAKWKNKHGEWIYADYIAVKNLKKHQD